MKTWLPEEVSSPGKRPQSRQPLHSNYGISGNERLRLDRFRWLKLLTVLSLVVLVVLIGFLKTRNIVSFWYSPLIQVYSLATALYVLSRVGLSFIYTEPKDRGILKSVTIIISAKNEEEHIAKTVEQCYNFDYPSHLIELVVIDDGSTDRTWEALVGLQSKYPLLQLFRFKENRGKRHGMALGAQKAGGEILVFIDSDVLVDAGGLYRIIQPFADPAVGAVAGHTQVIIKPDNIISKMESVRYFVSQRVVKAAESVFGAVTCCPGPFSAYRRSAVLEVLEAWLHQTFLGSVATFGDDRSLTNFILRNFKVVYHSGARCRTYVPQRWPIFIRQQLRWKKSWIRETSIAVRFMFRENAVAALSYYLGVIVSLASPIVLLRAFIYAPFFLSDQAYLHYLGGLFLIFLLLGLVYYYRTGSKYWYYGLLFAIVYSWFFSLQTYYAMLTVRRNHWGTR
jgi:hyaluronan synthase